MTLLAATEWPEAAIAIAGVAGFATVISVLIWQIFATGRIGISSRSAKEHERLVGELAKVQHDTTVELQKANDALAQLRAQIADLEQGVREVDRVLKAVE